MNDDEKALFEQEMADVKRLVLEEKVRIDSGPALSIDSKRERVQAAQVQRVDPAAVEMELVAPNDVIAWMRPGVAHGVYKNLRLGKYPVDARLDLHKLTVLRAEKEVAAFISQCQEFEVRTALILHGKGERQEPPALLKSYVNQWLRKIDAVLAFHSAQPRQGGSGAVYVLIKKSSKAKLANRERFR